MTMTHLVVKTENVLSNTSMCTPECSAVWLIR